METQQRPPRSPQYDFVIFGLRYHFGPKTLVQQIRATVNEHPSWELVFGCDICGFVCTDARRCYCCEPRGRGSRSLTHETGAAHPHHAICEVPIFLAELDKDENFIEVEDSNDPRIITND